MYIIIFRHDKASDAYSPPSHEIQILNCFPNPSRLRSPQNPSDKSLLFPGRRENNPDGSCCCYTQDIGSGEDAWISGRFQSRNRCRSIPPGQSDRERSFHIKKCRDKNYVHLPQRNQDAHLCSFLSAENGCWNLPDTGCPAPVSGVL